jgi:hypothetical protein
MKVGAITSGVDSRAIGAMCGGREPEEVQQEIDDVKKLLRCVNFREIWS